MQGKTDIVYVEILDIIKIRDIFVNICEILVDIWDTWMNILNNVKLHIFKELNDFAVYTKTTCFGKLYQKNWTNIISILFWEMLVASSRATYF